MFAIGEVGVGVFNHRTAIIFELGVGNQFGTIKSQGYRFELNIVFGHQLDDDGSNLLIGTDDFSFNRVNNFQSGFGSIGFWLYLGNGIYAFVTRIGNKEQKGKSCEYFESFHDVVILRFNH